MGAVSIPRLGEPPAVIAADEARLMIALERLLAASGSYGHVSTVAARSLVTLAEKARAEGYDMAGWIA